MTDSFTETSSRGWFSRLGEAFKGILLGLVLFIASFPLLFWNEGRAVRTYLALREGEGAVVEVSADKVDPANQGKLIHITGQATTTDTLKDPDFGVAINALRLKRVAEIYQWEEKTSTRTEKTVGGGERTITNYTYSKIWSDRQIDSSRFKQSGGHVNTGSFDFAPKISTAPKITVGAFTLSPDLSSSITNFEPLPSDKIDLMKGSEAIRRDWKKSGEWAYRGADPGSPAIGDMRVKFLAALPTTVSLFSQQTGDSFRPYPTKQGEPIERLEMGTHSAKEMFDHAQSENTMVTWLLRGVGLVVMWLGITLVFRPLVVVADVIPFIGNLLQMGVGLFALMLALPLTLVTIAIGWIFYRPVLGLSLLAAAALIFGFFVVQARKRKAVATG